MRSRMVVLVAACALAVACHRPDPYWAQVDALYQQASQVFTNAYSNPTTASIDRLQELRDQIRALPHSSAVDRYHKLVGEELDSGVAVLTAIRDHDAARADSENQKLRELQKQVDQERQRIGPRR